MKEIGEVLISADYGGVEGILVSRAEGDRFVLLTRFNTCIKVPINWNWVKIGKVDTVKALRLYEKFLEFKNLAKDLWEDEWEEKVANNDNDNGQISFFKSNN